MTHDRSMTNRQRYPSDLTEERWKAISPMLPGEKKVGRPRARDLREIVDAINYHFETGCVWRMLPHDFPPWGTVYSYFRKWQRTGVLRTVREELLRPARPRRSRPPQPTFAPRDFQNPGTNP